jgi:hypothetical protein
VNNKLNGSNGTASLRDKTANLITSITAKAAFKNEYFFSLFTVDDGVINLAKLQRE